MMDDDMSELVQKHEWLADLNDQVDAAQAKGAAPIISPEQQKAYNHRTRLHDLLPPSNEMTVAPTSAAVMLPPMAGAETSLSGGAGQSVEFCLERWNAIGGIVDAITNKSR